MRLSFQLHLKCPAPMAPLPDTSQAPVVTHVEPLSMSTLEISELTGKQHKDVLYDTRKMLSDLEKRWADFSAQ